MLLPFEATDEPALPGIVDKAWDWTGRIDLLVNNAGISQRSFAQDTDMAVYRRIMEVDYFAPVALTQLVLPRMLARGQGHLAAVTSVAGKVGAPLRSAYCSAKHALHGYFDALRAEVTHQGLHVTLITPGYVRTDVAKNALMADGAPRGETDEKIAGGMDPDKAAAIMVKALGARRAEVAMGGAQEMLALRLKRLSPALLNRVTAGMAKKIRESGARP